jgi:hypothetical protein
MGAIDRLFGLCSLLAGIVIAIYYTLWLVLTIVTFRKVITYTAIRIKRVKVKKYSCSLQQVFLRACLAIQTTSSDFDCRIDCDSTIYHKN